MNQIESSLGGFLYRIEYSHWNDFLTGPAIVSVLFPLVFIKIYRAFQDQDAICLIRPDASASAHLDQTFRFARILMNVGLFWFFIQAWAEKAGYLSNPHSKDEVDLPFEFAGTMLGFWIARVLTKPFDQRSEKFRSTVSIDFISSGVIGLLYTLVIGPLTENVAGAVGHALYPSVPSSLEVHEYTLFQQHMRPLELLLLAGAMWWCLNGVARPEQMMSLSNAGDKSETDSRWDALKTMMAAVVIVAGYLLALTAMFSLMAPEGLGWALITAGAGIGGGTAAFIIVKRVSQKGVTTLFEKRMGRRADP